MSNFKETIVTSAAQIDSLFAACPALYEQAHSIFKMAAGVHAAAGKSDFAIEVEAPKRNHTGWCEPLLYVTFVDGARTLIGTDVKPAASGRHSWSESRAAAILVECDGCTRFPQRKDGTFNADKIVERILEQANRLWMQRREHHAGESADALAKQVRAANGLSEYSDVVCGRKHWRDGARFRTSTPSIGKVFVSINTQLDPEKAAQLIAAARALGINLR